MSLCVHVYPVPDHARPTAGDCCDDQNTQTGFAQFAGAKLGDLSFNFNAANVPSNLTATAETAIRHSMDPWNDVRADYLRLAGSGGAAGPALDGTNTVGWLNMVPPSTLAATWTDDATGRIVQADVFFNTRHDWAVHGDCDSTSGSFDVVNVGVHEFGHTVALSHVNNQFATMAPTASRGEIRKITLTTGDAAGFAASLAGPPPAS